MSSYSCHHHSAYLRAKKGSLFGKRLDRVTWQTKAQRQVFSIERHVPSRTCSSRHSCLNTHAVAQRTHREWGAEEVKMPIVTTISHNLPLCEVWTYKVHKTGNRWRLLEGDSFPGSRQSIQFMLKSNQGPLSSKMSAGRRTISMLPSVCFPDCPMNTQSSLRRPRRVQD